MINNDVQTRIHCKCPLYILAFSQNEQRQREEVKETSLELLIVLPNKCLSQDTYDYEESEADKKAAYVGADYRDYPSEDFDSRSQFELFQNFFNQQNGFSNQPKTSSGNSQCGWYFFSVC